MYIPEKKNGKTILLLPGLPASSNIDKLLNTLTGAGFIVYLPSFSGSFDSGGVFSVESCIKDVGNLYQLCIKSKVKELYFGKEIEIGTVTGVILMGMSFGSVIALLGHRNKFEKMVLLSSALLFNSKDFPNAEIGEKFKVQMISLISLLKNALPFSYRVKEYSLMKNFLLGKKEIFRKPSIVGSLNSISFPVLVLHGENDTSVSIDAIKELEKEVKNPYILWKYTGSGHSTNSYDNATLEYISDFIVN